MLYLLQMGVKPFYLAATLVVATAIFWAGFSFFDADVSYFYFFSLHTPSPAVRASASAVWKSS